MGHGRRDTAPVVHADTGDQVDLRALPQGDDRHVRVAQVVKQTRLVAHVAQQEDRVALACLEHGRQGVRLGGLRVRVAQDDVVATRPGLGRDGLDGPREERVRDVADDGAEQHHRRPAQGPGQRIGPVAHRSGGGQDTLAGRSGDRHGQRGIVDDPRHGAPRHAGRDRDVSHRHRPAADRLSLGSGLQRRPRRRVVAWPCGRLPSRHRYSNRRRSRAWTATAARMTAP